MRFELNKVYDMDLIEFLNMLSYVDYKNKELEKKYKH